MSLASRATTLSVIRLAMLGGVVILGAVALYLAREGVIRPLDETAITTLRFAFATVLGCSAVAMVVLRRKRAALSSDDDPTALNIAGWALGEAVALFGAVILLLSGNLIFFLVGFVMMLVAFVFFPVPQD